MFTILYTYVMDFLFETSDVSEASTIEWMLEGL